MHFNARMTALALVVLAATAGCGGSSGSPAGSVSETATATASPTPVPSPTVAAPTEAPTAAPTQALTPAPTPAPTPVPAGPATSFDDGTFVIGTDIASGTYRAPSSSGCYWERLSGFGGTLAEILANNIKPGSQVVTIAAGDAGFHAQGCGTWTQNLSPITSSPGAPFSDGTFIVGTDIGPGTWRSAGASSCYWERESGFSGTLSNIIANKIGGGAQVVTILASDAGFQSSGCGNWTKTG